MTLAIVLVTIGALALLLMLRIALLRHAQVGSGADLSEQIEPIDLEAFRNLVDPAEAEYLRRCLPRSQFRQVQRQRLLAVAAYIKAAARNAAVLTVIAQNALASADPFTAEAARRVVESALLLRRNSGLILIRIYLQFVWPQSGLAATPMVSAYEKLNGSAMLLGRLQNPALPIRISAQ
jgi:hypothetical protein